ncbi:uncharacterized protein LOC111283642 [Durio zibethinus]|uniref:Uncharacterized protein LOC111283642 n=1 Tax=Durio zibethinus TaxID=66656 RepID=A0A6P5XHV6_DURZI|nr:uncharacterized protein LOC111283642 [Durio zibethinus]XP_022727944.1 uncharacterized protein LOC111283642 [Durio zibethinus]
MNYLLFCSLTFSLHISLFLYLYAITLSFFFLFIWMMAHLFKIKLDNLVHCVQFMLQMCHKHRVMRCNLKPENFLSANKKETSPLKVLMNQRLMFGVMQLSSIFYFVVSYHYGQVGLSLNEVFAFVHLTLWRLELKTAIEAVCAFRACGQKIREIS